jgi:uncharacterized membrane protein YkoI
MQYALQNITNQVEIGLDIFDNYNEHITQEIKTANKNVEYTYTCTCIDDDDDYYDQDDNDSDDNEPANSRSL